MNDIKKEGKALTFTTHEHDLLISSITVRIAQTERQYIKERSNNRHQVAEILKQEIVDLQNLRAKFV